MIDYETFWKQSPSVSIYCSIFPTPAKFLEFLTKISTFFEKKTIFFHKSCQIFMSNFHSYQNIDQKTNISLKRPLIKLQFKIKPPQFILMNINISIAIIQRQIGHALHNLHPTFKKYTFDERMQNVAKALEFRKPSIVQSMIIYKNPKIGASGEFDSRFLFTLSS